MKKLERRILGAIMAVMLCLTSMSLTSFASELPEVTPEEVVETVEVSTDEIVQEEQAGLDEGILSEQSAADAEDAADSVVEEETVLYPAYDYATTIDGYEIALNAPEGVFPEGTTVSIEKYSKAEEEKVEALVEEVTSKDENIEKTVTFDITFRNAEGVVIEPETDSVNVSIKMADKLLDEIESANDVEVRIYHITDDEKVERVAAQTSDEEVVVFEAESFSSYSLVVVSDTVPDVTAPKIASIELSSNEYVLNGGDYRGDYPQLTAKVTDDLSGVANVTICFYDSKDNVLGCTLYPEAPTDENTAFTDIYSGSLSFDNTVPGTYKIGYICASDNVGNYVYYDSTNIPKKYRGMKIVVKQSTQFTANVNSVWVEKNKVSVKKETVEVPFSVNASANKDIQSINVKLYTKADGFTYYKTGYIYYYFRDNYNYFDNPVVYDPSFTGKFYFSCYDAGTWKIDSITLRSVDGDSYTITSKSLPSALKKQSIKVTAKGPSSSSKSAPVINSVTFDTNQVSLNGSDTTVGVNIQVTDNDYGLEYADVIFEDSYGRRFEAYGRGEYDEMGNPIIGTVTIHNEWYISKYMPGSTYKIIAALAYDNAGNKVVYCSPDFDAHGYGGVIAKSVPKKLKKVKFTIKNTYSYNVKFDKNGGTGKMATMKKLKGNTKYKLTANTFKRKGYKFAGWNTAPDGSGISYKNKATIKNIVEQKGTVVLYAQWVAK